MAIKKVIHTTQRREREDTFDKLKFFSWVLIAFFLGFTLSDLVGVQASWYIGIGFVILMAIADISKNSSLKARVKVILSLPFTYLGFLFLYYAYVFYNEGDTDVIFLTLVTSFIFLYVAYKYYIRNSWVFPILKNLKFRNLNKSIRNKPKNARNPIRLRPRYKGRNQKGKNRRRTNQRRRGKGNLRDQRRRR